MLRLLFALLASWPALFAQVPRANQGNEQVRLRIVDRHGGPVPNGTIEVMRPVIIRTMQSLMPVRPQRSFQAKDLQDGCLVLENMPTGTFVVIVEDGVHVRTISSSFAITPGQAREVRVQMSMGGTLHGTVLDDSGKPIAGAVVSTEDPPLLQPGRWTTPGSRRTKSSTKTDKHGRFSLPRLAYGSYALRIRPSPPHCSQVHHSYEVGKLAIAPLEFSLARGTLISGTCRCEQPDGRTIEVRLTSTTAKPIAISMKVQVAGDGSYRFDEAVPPGKYRLKAYRTAHESPFDTLLDMKSSQILIDIPAGQPAKQFDLTIAKRPPSKQPLDK